jgi:hypothetical protein
MQTNRTRRLETLTIDLSNYSYAFSACRRRDGLLLVETSRETTVCCEVHPVEVPVHVAN